jgi:hypothetical protein
MLHEAAHRLLFFLDTALEPVALKVGLRCFEKPLVMSDDPFVPFNHKLAQVEHGFTLGRGRLVRLGQGDGKCAARQPLDRGALLNQPLLDEPAFQV